MLNTNVGACIIVAQPPCRELRGSACTYQAALMIKLAGCRSTIMITNQLSGMDHLLAFKCSVRVSSGTTDTGPRFHSNAGSQSKENAVF